MAFIKLNEKYYDRCGYLRRPLLLNVNEISSVSEDTSGYEDFTVISMCNGKTFRVAERYDEVEKLIAKARAAERGLDGR